MLYIILLAAGSSERFGEKSKIFAHLNNSPLFLHSLNTFLELKEKKEIILIIKKEDKGAIQRILKDENLLSEVKLVIGGGTRQKSAFKGFLFCHSLEKGNLVDKNNFVVIHNSANPFVSLKEIKNCLKIAKQTGVAAIGNKIVDTIKKVDDKNIVETLSKQNLYAMQTPQIIRMDIYEKAYEFAQKTGFEGTDDLSLVENLMQSDQCSEVSGQNFDVKIVPASRQNFKITTKEDLEMVKKVMRSGQCQKIGLGEDAHWFNNSPSFGKERGLGGELTLGGVKFKNHPPFKANSDGDVMIHSLCNALSSALGGKSLGSFADKMCLENGITDSKEFVKPLLEKFKKQNLKIQSVSFSIECLIPKIDPIAYDLKKSLAKILHISKDKIGITATTADQTSVFGEGKGVRCSCVVLVLEI